MVFVYMIDKDCGAVIIVVAEWVDNVEKERKENISNMTLPNIGVSIISIFWKEGNT